MPSAGHQVCLNTRGTCLRGRREREKPFPGQHAEQVCAEQAYAEHSGKQQSLGDLGFTAESPGELVETNCWAPPCQLMVIGANSTPTGAPNLGCGEENFIQSKQLNYNVAQL